MPRLAAYTTFNGPSWLWRRLYLKGMANPLLRLRQWIWASMALCRALHLHKSSGRPVNAACVLSDMTMSNDSLARGRQHSLRALKVCLGSVCQIDLNNLTWICVGKVHRRRSIIQDGIQTVCVVARISGHDMCPCWDMGTNISPLSYMSNSSIQFVYQDRGHASVMLTVVRSTETFANKYRIEGQKELLLLSTRIWLCADNGRSMSQYVN